MLLPREQLSLSCLDFASPLGQFEYARFYESTIKILDLEGRMGSRPVVLIARLETDKTVYALERQDNGLYSLCKLGNWVDLESLSTHATVAYSKLIKPRSNAAASHVHPEAPITPQLQKENKKRRLAIEAIQSLVKRPARSQSVSFPSQGAEITRASTPAEDAASQSVGAPLPSDAANVQLDAQKEIGAAVTPGTDEALPQPTVNEIFDNVRTQYLEALYHSMVNPPPPNTFFWRGGHLIFSRGL
jgi:DNA replication regulator SLD3